MRINNNAAAFGTWTSYTQNQDMLKSSMSRLSTGVIQNTDDPAGIGISERMRAQAKGTEMARFNTDNAISLVQTADSWLQKTNDMLSRMKSLSIEAAGIMSDTDKGNLQVEFEAMQDEISRITSEYTAAGKFNGLYLFRGGNGTTGANDSIKGTGGIPAEAAGQQQIGLSASDSSLIALAGGGYIMANDSIDGTNAGIQLFDADGNKIGGPNVSIEGVEGITALATGGFIAESSTDNSLQRYDRYGNKVGSEIDIDAAVAGFTVDDDTEIISLENGNILLSDGDSVAMVDLNANASIDQVISVTTGATNVNIAAFDDGSFLIEDDGTINKYDANGIQDSSLSGISATNELSGEPDKLVTLKDGSFLAIDETAGEIQRYDANGSKFGELIKFNDTIAADSLTALDDGGFMVAVTRDSGGNTANSLVLERFSADNAKFEEIMVSNGRNTVSNVDIAVLSNGDFVAEWSQDDEGGDAHSYAKKYEMTSGINLQIGADLGQTLNLDMPNLDIRNYEIMGSFEKVSYNSDNSVAGTTSTDVRWNDVIDKNKLNVTSDDVIGKLDIAINFISESRAGIAAQQNRLQNTKEGLLSYQDNLQAAESKIRDVDMAAESTNFSKTQVLSNASNAILAQANGLPQSVLQLIG